MSKKKKKAPAVKDTGSENDAGLFEETKKQIDLIPHSDDFTEEDFRKSVVELKSENIAGSETEAKLPKKRKTKKKRSKLENIIELSILGICAVVAIVSIIMLTKNIWGKVRGAEIYDSLDFDGFTVDGEGNINSYNHPSALDNLTGDTPMLSLYARIDAGKNSDHNSLKGKYSKQLANMRASLTALKQHNPDVVGWIHIEGTNIDYPVMQGDDNDYYLARAYTGEELPIGSIFMDCGCSEKIAENQNTVIYGHNVVTGAMFHDLEKFLDEEFFADNLIYLYTMDGVYIYKPVAIYDTESTYMYFRTRFSSEDEFLSFAGEMLGNSKVYSDEKFVKGDRMLTLSTCTNQGDRRYAMHAKLIEEITE